MVHFNEFSLAPLLWPPLPLSPGNPLEAADILLRSRRLREAEVSNGRVIEQALLTVEDERPFNHQDQPAQWQERMQDLKYRRLKWEPDKQQFE